MLIKYKLVSLFMNLKSRATTPYDVTYMLIIKRDLIN